ncbi:MAG: hypothetical protein WC708_14575 [Lentisphaeria bacterium]
MPSVPPSDAIGCFLEQLAVLRRLNPDLARLEQPALLAAAAALPPAAFPAVAAFAAELVQQHRNSPWKRAETRLLEDYFQRLDAAARLLAPDAPPAAADGGTPAAASTLALVSPRPFSPLEWCQAHARAGLPQALLQGVEAARERNRMTGTVFETLFAVLHRLDSPRAFAWELAFLKEQEGRLDPDLTRDLLLAWLDESDPPRAALNWALDWAGDDNLERQWPAVTAAADALLRRAALRRWAELADTLPPLNAFHDLRRRIAGTAARYGEPFRAWFEAAAGEIGERVRFFLDTGDALAAPAADAAGTSASWRRPALQRELTAVTALAAPVLLLADLALNVPAGARRFALSLFGFAPAGEGLWRRRLEEQADRAIRRLFLWGLRQGTPAGAIIRRLCFDDETLWRQLEGALDLHSKEFDSLAQRNRVAGRLAVHYLSRREAGLLAAEISRRYRSLMRTLHEDHLHRLLGGAPPPPPPGAPSLADIMGLAADARRFLARRRDLQLDLEELAAAELVFARAVRQRRLRLIRDLLGPG